MKTDIQMEYFLLIFFVNGQMLHAGKKCNGQTTVQYVACIV